MLPKNIRFDVSEQFLKRSKTVRQRQLDARTWDLVTFENDVAMSGGNVSCRCRQRQWKELGEGPASAPEMCRTADYVHQSIKIVASTSAS